MLVLLKASTYAYKFIQNFSSKISSIVEGNLWLFPSKLYASMSLPINFLESHSVFFMFNFDSSIQEKDAFVGLELIIRSASSALVAVGYTY